MAGALDATKQTTVQPAVVSISDGWGICSGFIIGKSYVITAKHCTTTSDILLITFYDKREIIGVVVYTDPENDFVIVKTNTYKYPALKYTIEEPEFGTIVEHYRFNVQEDAQYVAKGVYAKEYCDGFGWFSPCLLYVAAALVPGDSGGPVVREDTKEVIGVTAMSFWPIGAPMSMLVPMRYVVEKWERVLKLNN